MPPVTSRLPPTPLLIGAGAALFVAITILVSAAMTDAFDQWVTEAIRAPALRDVLGPLGVVTELGSTLVVSVMAFVALAVGIALGSWRHGVAAALTILVASLGNSALKLTMARARPDLLEPIIVEHGFSFPSGHSALGMVAYGVLAVLASRSGMPLGARRAIIVGLGLVVALIGISRVWLGVHYPTDVIAGWTAGGVVVLAYAALTRPASPGPVAAAVDEGRAGQRSDRSAAG